jgi:hypothetical protein
MLLALASTPRPPTPASPPVSWSVINENTPPYDLELLGTEGSPGPRRESPHGPERLCALAGPGSRVRTRAVLNR